MNNIGTVFNIQKFCINDGPGIRTTVFLKGCPLRCIWCHNPESNTAKPEILYTNTKCIGCGACFSLCPNNCHLIKDNMHIYNRQDCISCGVCADACPANSLELAGKKMGVSEVMDEVLKDKIFYDNSGGGITVSGGEPLMQFEFTYSLLSEAKKQGLHTAMETCGYADEEKIRKIAEVCDLFLFDWKETDSQKHKEFTKFDNKLILNNLTVLSNIGANIILRCPIIPTMNERDDHFEGIARLANELNILEIHVEPYHPLGNGKNERLGKESPMEEISIPENETVEGWIKKIQAMTQVTVKKA